MLDYSLIIDDFAAKNSIMRDIASNRVSHAYLFLSQDENLLNFFCEYVCKLLISQNDAINKEKNSLRITKHIHPDVKFFGEDKAIDAKNASQIVEEADFSPFESDKKIFVILNAGEMNEASQNKILKTIEEPPENTYFLLAATSKSKILPTILSRVKELELDKISYNQMVQLLENSNISNSDAQIFASCSNGNATFAEKIAQDNGFVNFYKNIVTMFFSLDGSKDVLKFSAIFADKKIDKNEFFDISTSLLRDMLCVYAKTENLVINKSVLANLRAISQKMNYDAIIILLDCSKKCKEMLKFNVSGVAVVDEFLYKLAEVKVKCRRL